eukprot:12135512-Alexandrium_andersonii.AAC.1
MDAARKAMGDLHASRRAEFSGIRAALWVQVKLVATQRAAGARLVWLAAAGAPDASEQVLMSTLRGPIFAEAQ